MSLGFQLINMNINFQKQSLMFLACSLLTACAFSEFKSPGSWEAEFKSLVPGLSRVAAEKEISKIRKVKSSYDLWAMDTHALVAYRLDPETILLVTYKPGIPAAHTINGQANQPPEDGKVIEYQVLQLK